MMASTKSWKPSSTLLEMVSSLVNDSPMFALKWEISLIRREEISLKKEISLIRRDFLQKKKLPS